MIHGLCVVKNELDIIVDSLSAAAKWCDRIYVLDNDSDDGTWETVRRLAYDLPQVIPYDRIQRPFDSSIREDILRRYAADAQLEDWWCILDADEFYVDDPREFLLRVPRRYKVVWKHDFSYYFTTEDLAAYRRDPSLYTDQVPVQRRLRYYSADWSEMRFFRQSSVGSKPRIPWDSPGTYPRRIRVKHFQYRSPAQIQKRLETRRQAMERGSFPHEKRISWIAREGGKKIVTGPAPSDQIPERWEERIVSTTGLHYDSRDGTYAEGKAWRPPAGPGMTTRFRKRLARFWKKGRWVGRMLIGVWPGRTHKGSFNK